MLDLLFPPSCAVCGREARLLCVGCLAALPAAGPGPPPAGLDECVALVAYEGMGCRLVTGLKYRNHRPVATLLGRALAPSVSGGVDLVTWVPTSRSRRRARGFDQARLLAVAVARAGGWPCRATLDRLPGPPQTGASRVERLTGPRFRLGRDPTLEGVGRILVVDDVVTTGATLSAAAAALRGRSTRRISAAVVARTPDRRGNSSRPPPHRPTTEPIVEGGL